MSDLLTVEQVAEILGVSCDTVLRRFEGVKGVIDLGQHQGKRRYRILRIPRAVIEKFALQRGGRLAIPPNPSPSPNSKLETKPPTEDDIARDLAQAATQRGVDAQRTLDRIARRARLMAKFIPPEHWDSLVWFDDPDED
jgi:hypothetical protein